MSTSREGPNPLRPYYIPPSVGHPPNAAQNARSAPRLDSKNVSPSTNSLGSSARNILADIDYSEYIGDSSPSTSGVLKGLMEQAAWKYTSVILAQPFEVSKTILQVQVAKQGRAASKANEDMRRRPGSYKGDSYDLSDGSDPDSTSYFTSSAPLAHTPTRHSRPRRRQGSPEPNGIPRVHTPQPPPAKKASPHSLDLRSSSSVSAVLASLWSTEGSWGLWKGTNSTYIYSIFLSTLTSFVRSFFSAFLALPDPGLSFTAAPNFSYAGGLDVLSSHSPLASLTVAVSAAGIAGIILAPLDIARTKLMLTPSTHPPRSILTTLKNLTSWTLPFSIAPTAILHSTLPTLISTSTPLLLRSKLGIDPMLTPNLYSFGAFIGQVFELGVKLPIETVLRRGQMEVAQTSDRGREMPTIVEIGPYKGLFGTMRYIVYEEGERGPQADLVQGISGAPAMKVGKAGQERKKRKGQGFEGLWKGWRVGMWGLAGVWGATILGGAGSKGGEF
ncbi:mitochondrial fusion and transport protein ugo1 [Puttea exsequens]|nr:mitochondrial fusion and transport protein ugo1 [Puttea exsequens]